MMCQERAARGRSIHSADVTDGFVRVTTVLGGPWYQKIV